MPKNPITKGFKDNDVEAEIRGDTPSAGLAIETSRHKMRFGEYKNSQARPNSIDGGPEAIHRPAAQDLPGASGGSRQRWRSMINGGSPEQPDKDGTARHDPYPDLPAKPVQPGADLSGRGERVSPHKKPQS